MFFKIKYFFCEMKPHPVPASLSTGGSKIIKTFVLEFHCSRLFTIRLRLCNKYNNKPKLLTCKPVKSQKFQSFLEVSDSFSAKKYHFFQKSASNLRFNAFILFF